MYFERIADREASISHNKESCFRLLIARTIDILDTID